MDLAITIASSLSRRTSLGICHQAFASDRLAERFEINERELYATTFEDYLDAILLAGLEQR